MQYILLIHADETAFAKMTPEMVGLMTEPYQAYNAALAKAGAMVAGERLQPSHASTTVRIRDGKTEVLDGPFAVTKEQLGGFYLIEAPDLDAALAWAARCPAASHGTVEVRPIWPTPCTYAAEDGQGSPAAGGAGNARPPQLWQAGSRPLGPLARRRRRR